MVSGSNVCDPPRRPAITIFTGMITACTVVAVFVVAESVPTMLKLKVVLLKTNEPFLTTRYPRLLQNALCQPAESP
jgi:hypothetical protein